ncbi:sulfite exporter TauE/SafE family protein [Humitalea sp. 24SJ18S-53]|uniref:sulfite exporter TauE/SafE family protein n=1 Tax=Humitalea sp. 24SJ18S-53 TaxID=3422307 RepID=UPI003D67DF30
MLASCLHALDALGADGLPALMAALFLAGLVGGASHCAAMCGPFVLAQVARGDSLDGGRLQRLGGAMLLPYHLGRAAGYATLGAFAGGFTAVLALLPGLAWVPPVLLLVAAIAMLAQALPALAALLPRAGLGALPGRLAGLVAPLLDRPGGGRSFLLGVLLSALPCGLLYGALAGAAASGSALAGALAMAAFVAGTAPALVGVALLGRIFRRRAEPALRRVAPALYGLNSLVLLALAVRMIP